MTYPTDMRLYQCPHGCEYMTVVHPVVVAGRQAASIQHDDNCPLYVPDPAGAASEVIEFDPPVYDPEFGWADDVKKYTE